MVNGSSVLAGWTCHFCVSFPPSWTSLCLPPLSVCVSVSSSLCSVRCQKDPALKPQLVVEPITRALFKRVAELQSTLEHQVAIVSFFISPSWRRLVVVLCCIQETVESVGESCEHIVNISVRMKENLCERWIVCIWSWDCHHRGIQDLLELFPPCCFFAL